MNRLKTLLITYIDRLFKRGSKKKSTIWIEVPLSCNTVEDRNDIIFTTLNLLEQIIIVKNK